MHFPAILLIAYVLLAIRNQNNLAFKTRPTVCDVVGQPMNVCDYHYKGNNPTAE